MPKKIYCLFIALATFSIGHSQLMNDQKSYTRADTLRGSLRPERTNFEVLKYNLYVDVDPEKKYITGNNRITFKMIDHSPVLQLDLFKNMEVDSIVFQGKKLRYQREYNAVFIHFEPALAKGNIDSLDFYYSGHPIVAKTPPWDGGFIFTKDQNGKDWISVAVQGTGASLWYPNKDTQNDEPEEAEIHVTVPKGLKDISNGRLTHKEELPDGRTTWSWKVVNPINNYNLVLNIGDYVHFSDKFRDVDLDYYVLPYHLDQAQKEFKEVKPMLKCYTEKFGDYPFKEDGYKLIETPYLGMEHQSAIGYGNQFKKGYAGKDRSQTGIGLKWDFIIIHESGHEWFGNSITASDIADMWIHEAFTTYAEAVYIECRWGKKEAFTYLKGLRKNTINNDSPIIGDYGVNKEGSSDMYSKGANMLLTIRSILNNDKKWWALMKNFYNTFKYQIINTQDVVNFFNTRTTTNLRPVFNQYLRYKNIPVLALKKEKKKVYYRWEVDVPNFEMPIDISISGTSERLYPTQEWKKLDHKTPLKAITVDTDRFYITVEKQ